MKILMILSLATLFVIISAEAKAQNFTSNCPENIIVKADSGKGGTYVNLPTAAAGSGIITYTPASGSFFKIGSTSVIVTSTSGQRCSFTVTVTDNEPPTLSPIVLSSKRLWPANGRMRELSVRYISTDNSNESSCAISVSSNDPDSTSRDWEVINNHSIRLKALRLRSGMARVYMITVTCADASGNTSKRTTGISVARSISEK